MPGAAELPLSSALHEVHAQLRRTNPGAVATYIPPLADADPEHLAIAVVTIDGHTYDVGDSSVAFTIQSVSKPFAYGLALDDLGVEAVIQRVGVEPTGEAFNSITVDEMSGRPFNPMVNAGAIVTTSLLAGAGPDERTTRLLRGLGLFAGRALATDEAVFQAECATGDRNRAIAYLMRTFGMLREQVDSAVETYFRQCSVLIDTRDLAVMGATLANAGVNPVSGLRALEVDHVARVLSVMSSCGMYDYSGEWLYRIGLPAKSGVSGAIVAVLPGVLAVAAYSPRLDPRGNSVRGIEACEALARTFRLHAFDPRPPAPVVRRTFDAAAVRSKRRRTPEHERLLKTAGSRVQIIEVQGPFHFGSVETLSRDVAAVHAGTSRLLLDMSRVTSIDAGSVPLLRAVAAAAAHAGVLVVGVGPHSGTLQESGLLRTFPDLDTAMEWCEDEVLRECGAAPDDVTSEFAAQELLQGLSCDALEQILAVTSRQTFPPGAVIFREGDPADAIYFVVEGRVRVSIESAGQRHRLTTVGPGSCFGEMSMVDGRGRSSTVEVEQDLVCEVLPLGALERLEPSVPGVLASFYRNVARTMSHRLRDANEAMRVLQG